MSSGEAYDNKGLGHTVLKVEIKSNSGKSSNPLSNCEFIFVMDKSGSMGSYVNDILTRVFPKVYDKLNFPGNKEIHLLTFDDKVNYYSYLLDLSPSAIGINFKSIRCSAVCKHTTI